jgi:hypothetical protein
LCWTFNHQNHLGKGLKPISLSVPRAHAGGGAPYISGLGPLRDVSSPALRRGSPPGFPALAAPAGTDIVASSALPATDSSLVAALATIQATVAASRERERTTSLALEQERALGAALTTQMATAQRLLLGRPSVNREDPR